MGFCAPFDPSRSPHQRGTIYSRARWFNGVRAVARNVLRPFRIAWTRDPERFDALEGKIALITGADSGIGQAIAEEFAREGADIAEMFHSDRAGRGDWPTRRGPKPPNGRASVDVRDETSVAALFEAVARDLGTPDILVNDAGVGGGGTSVAETKTEEFDRVIKTDLYGPFFCSREFIRRRQAAGGRGRIINITSVHEPLNRLIRLPFFDSIRAVYGVGQSPEAVQLQLECASRIIERLRADGGDDRFGGPGNPIEVSPQSLSP